MEYRASLGLLLFLICFLAIFLSIRDLEEKTVGENVVQMAMYEKLDQPKKLDSSKVSLDKSSEISNTIEVFQDLKSSLNTKILEERESFMPNGGKIPNPDFIFHNKVPKSGSSTMKHILKFLAKQGLFISYI